MDQTIDCLFIGDNTMSISERASMLAIKGLKDSAAYRDASMNFISYDNRKYTASELFNMFYYDEASNNDSYGKITNTGYLNSTIAYLGNFLSNRGLNFDYVNSFKKEKDILIKKLKENNVLTIAIPTTVYSDFYPIVEIIGFVRKYSKGAKIIVGGPFILNWVEITPKVEVQNTLKMTGIDFAIYSTEGESALVGIIKALKCGSGFNGINNIFYRVGAEYIFTKSVPENNSFEDDIIDWNLFKGKVGRFVNVRTSRSCPFSCSFCNFPHFAGPYKISSVENVERILNGVNDLGTVFQVNFIDDTFNVPTKRFKEILRMIIKNKYRFKWNSFFRCQYADRETVELMKESGCEGVFLGIESGSQEILNNMNKSVRIEQYQEGLSLLNEYGIISSASFIVGFPGETYETYQETKKFIEDNKPTFYRASLWLCDPLSSIYKNGEGFKLKGSYSEWSHATMDSVVARNLVDDLFLTINNSIWIKSDEYDYLMVFHMLRRGLSLQQIKSFFSYFNMGLKEMIVDSSNNQISSNVFNRIWEVCLQTT